MLKLVFSLLLTLMISAASLYSHASLLDQLEENSQQLPSLTGSFKQTKIIAALPVPLSSHGSFHYDAANGITWSTLAPIHSTMKITSNGILDDSGKPQTANTQNFPSTVLLSVISGNLKSLTDYFTVEEMGDINDWQLSLTPKTAAVATYITAIEARGKTYTEELIITERNGDKTLIQFSADRL